ncbi:MAG: hypothetical protein C0P68_008485 [Bacillota bacterium]
MDKQSIKQLIPVEYPDEHTIQREIETIVARGILPKETFAGYLKKMVLQVGFKYLFRDMTEILFVIVLLLSVYLYISIQALTGTPVKQSQIYSYIFIFSPLFYFIIALLFFVFKERQSTYEVEMTCKYNIYQLAAFRMLLFSLLSIAADTLWIGCMAIVDKQIHFPTAWMISVTSLFLFSASFMYAFVRLRTHWYKLVSGWLVINLMLAGFHGDFYHMLLKKVPIYVYVALTLICLWWYLQNIKKLIRLKNNEGVTDNACRL